MTCFSSLHPIKVLNLSFKQRSDLKNIMHCGLVFHLLYFNRIFRFAFPSDTTVRSFPSTKGMHPTTCMERGIFGLGNPRADELALRWVLRHSLGVASAPSDTGRGGGGGPPKIGGAVVVFGSGIDALAAIGGLIKANVPPTLISLVIPETELEELGHSTVSRTTNTIHLSSLGLSC